MALTTISFGRVGTHGRNLPAMVAGTAVSEDVEPSSTSQATTIAATGKTGPEPFARVATDTDIYVAFGASPDATVEASRFMVPAGSVEYFAVEPGDKAAVGTLDVMAEE